MQANPVLAREFLGRWRRPLTPLSFFGYAAALAVAAGAYCQAYLVSSHVPVDQTGALGQDLFLVMARTQILLASLFATALTAPAIAAERESGTLVLLRLSPLPIRGIVFAKFHGAALLVMLLICVPLPMSSLTFVLGGVSAPDFIAVLLVQLSSSLFFAALGLACSAMARTAAKALGSSFLFTLCGVGVPIWMLEGFNSPNFVDVSVVLSAFIALFAWALVAGAVLRVETEPDYDLPGEAPPLALSIRQEIAETHSRPAVAEHTDASLEERTVHARQTRLTPFGRSLRFDNPVFERGLRKQLSFFTLAPSGEWILRILTSGVVCILWHGFWIPAFLADKASIELCVFFSGAALVSVATLGAAGSFAPERGQNMLTSLLLTPLSPREIAGGKRDAAFAAAGFYLLTAAPTYIAAIAADPGPGWAALAITLGFMALGSSCGLASAWLCPSPGIAIAGAFCCITGIFVAASMRLSFLRDDMRGVASPFWNNWWAPVAAHLVQPRTLSEWLLASALCLTILFAVAALLTLPVVRGLRPSALERDGESLLTRDLSKAI